MTFRLVGTSTDVTSPAPLMVECKWVSAQDKRIGDTWFHIYNLETDAQRVRRMTLWQYNELCNEYCDTPSYKSLSWIPLPLTEFLEGFQLQSVPSDEVLSGLLPNGMWNELFDFQKQGVRYGIQRNGCLLFGDEMGLGKTRQGLSVAYYYWIQTEPAKRRPIVVVAARASATGWIKNCKECFGWSEENGLAFAMDDGRSRPSGTPCFIFTTFDLLNQEAVYEWIHKIIAPQQIIVDESHHVKNANAQRTQTVQQLIESASQRILCTGTPIGSKPIELYTSLKMTQPLLFPVFMQSRKPKTPRELSFAWRYCDPRRSKFSRGWEYHGRKHSEELHQVITHVMMIRRTTEKVDPELEKLKIRQQVHIKVTPEFEEYFKMQRSKIHELRDKRPDQAKYKFMELWRLCSRAKLPSMLEEIREFLVRGEYAQKPKLKFIIFAYHNIVLDTVQQLLECYKVNFVRIDGRTSAKQRKEREDQFQSRNDGTPRVALINMKAGGHSITLTTADEEWFLEYHPDINVLLQAEKRAHRIGRAEPVRIRYLHADSTPDDNIWNLLLSKLRGSSLILDGHVRHFDILYCDSILANTGAGGTKQLDNDSDSSSEAEEEVKHKEQLYAEGIKRPKKRKTLIHTVSLGSDSFVPPPLPPPIPVANLSSNKPTSFLPSTTTTNLADDSTVKFGVPFSFIPKSIPIPSLPSQPTTIKFTPLPPPPQSLSPPSSSLCASSSSLASPMTLVAPS